MHKYLSSSDNNYRILIQDVWSLEDSLNIVVRNVISHTVLHNIKENWSSIILNELLYSLLLSNIDISKCKFYLTI